MNKQWRPIQTAPKDGSWILVFDPITEAPQRWVVSWCEFEGDPDGGSWIGTDLATITEPTAWMPLPELPNTPINGERSESAA
jgi:hypothetical protein